jgi:predicted amidohydrolase
VIRLVAVQYKAPNKEDKPRALREAAALVTGRSDLVVFPEMFATGYLFTSVDAARRIAEPADGPTFLAMADVARRTGAWVVAGFAERAADALFNSALVIDPRGERRFVYRKTLLYDADLPWATAGDSGYALFDTDFGRLSQGICMDLNDDRFVGWLRSAAADWIAFPTNWIEQGEDVHGYWAYRMLGVRGALVAANTWGPEQDTVFSGRSAVLRGGHVVAAAPASGNAAVYVTFG